MLPVGYVLCKFMAKLLCFPLTNVAVAIVILSFIGAYAIANSMVDIWVVFVFGILGFVSNKIGLDTGSMALGVILGPMIEENLGKCVDLANAHSGGLLGVMLEGSISKILIFALAVSLLTPFYINHKKRKSGRRAGED